MKAKIIKLLSMLSGIALAELFIQGSGNFNWLHLIEVWFCASVLFLLADHFTKERK